MAVKRGGATQRSIHHIKKRRLLGATPPVATLTPATPHRAHALHSRPPGPSARTDHSSHRPAAHQRQGTVNTPHTSTSTETTSTETARHSASAANGETVNPYRISFLKWRQIVKYGIDELRYRIDFDKSAGIRDFNQLHSYIYDIFETLLVRLKRHFDKEYKCRIMIYHAGSLAEKPLFVPLMPLHKITPNLIMSTLENVLNSNESVKLEDMFLVDVGILKTYRGGGRTKITQADFANPFNETRCKRSLISIPTFNNDYTCAARAVCVAYARLTGADTRHLRNAARREQHTAAETLLKSVGLPTSREIEVSEFHKFEDFLNVQIIIYKAPFVDGCIYAGSREREQKLFLYHSPNHFDVIGKMSGFLSKSFYCTTCRVAYDRIKRHSCAKVCTTCDNENCCEITSQARICPTCNMHCRNDLCFSNHGLQRSRGKKNIPSLCETFWRCTKCGRVCEGSEDSSNHLCGSYTCSHCHKVVKGQHLCYMRATSAKQTSGKFIFFDFECSVEKKMECEKGYKMIAKAECRVCTETGRHCNNCVKCRNCNDSTCGKLRHEPNFVVAHSVCGRCENDPLNPTAKCIYCGSRCYICGEMDSKQMKFKNPPCDATCGMREKTFEGVTTTDDFGQWLFNYTHTGCTVMAHNGRGYDFIFLLDYLSRKVHSQPTVVYSGAKITCISIRDYRMKLIDSLSFFPMSLRKLPKCFGLATSKGDFPHLFNVTANQQYKGAYPSIDYFDVDSLHTLERQQFIEWHAHQKDKLFDFKETMLGYCRQDVTILRLACMAFRKMVLEITASTTKLNKDGVTEYVNGTDPFASTTIASLCIDIFRTHHLKETFEKEPFEKEPCDKSKKSQTRPFVNSPIGIVPQGGYTDHDNFSKKSLLWLELVSRRSGLFIQHALNDGEYHIPHTNFKADGWSSATNTIFSFLGCYYHGCPTHTANVHGRIHGVMPTQLHAMTVDRSCTLKRMGFKIVEKWECDFDKECLTPEEKIYLDNFDYTARLNIRDAFFGGRTNPIVLHSKPTGGQQIKYYDVTSLYPWVNKTCKYPVGHPDIITKDFGDIRDYFGIVKVKVLPPQGLYHPVLPYRSNGKLKFPLCRTCGDTESLTLCVCPERDRAFIGSYVTVELHEALAAGYKILKIYEVYHWPQSTQYDPVSKTGGLFTTYINVFLKIKQESSGWPEGCITEADKAFYIQEYFEKEGIQLDPSKICLNPGMRVTAKALLNSLWGRLGLRPNLPRTLFAKTTEPFFEIVNNARFNCKNFHVINEDTVALVYETNSPYIEEDASTNIALAAFTTAHARIKLYSYIKQLGTRVLYFDTDSVIFLSDPEKPTNDPPLGNFLGDLTDELKQGTHIVEFAATGPKSYAYIASDGTQVCKVRGFTLNYLNSLAINFDVIKDMVLNQTIQNNPNCKKVYTINERKINRSKYGQKLYNSTEIKAYKAVYTKRVINDDLTTHPYGFIAT